jgi:ankyrin repeat protein
MEACHRGDHEQVEALLGTAEPDAETEPPDKQGKAQPKLSALAFAANLGDTTIVEKLLERAPQETHLFSALMLAARSGNETLARLLLNHSPGLAQMADDKVNLAIHKAALAGHDKVLNLLLTHDADATAANHFDETPLMMATRFGHSSTTALLLRNRADKNRSDGKGWTCLMRAAGNGHTKVVVELLKGSSDPLHVDAQDKTHDTTALMAACKSGQLDTASLLLDHDANTLLQDSDGRTALHHSASAGHDLVVKALLQQPDEVVKELAACTDARHMTPLMLACEHGCEGAVRLLLGPKKACAGAPRRCTPPTSSVPPPLPSPLLSSPRA